MIIYQLQRKPNGATEYVQVFNDNIRINVQRHLEITVMRFGKTAWDEGPIPAEDWNDGIYLNPVGQTDNGTNPGNSGSSQAVTNDVFLKIKKHIQDGYYDETMLTNAKVILKNNWLNTSQISEIGKLFTYDEGKLKFLKFAYDWCIDKGSYFTLTEVIYYDANKKQLLDFIASK